MIPEDHSCWVMCVFVVLNSESCNDWKIADRIGTGAYLVHLGRRSCHWFTRFVVSGLVSEAVMTAVGVWDVQWIENDILGRDWEVRTKIYGEIWSFDASSAPFGVATLLCEAEITVVNVWDLPRLLYEWYKVYFGKSIGFGGENLLKMRFWDTVLAAVSPVVVATLPYVSHMKATCIYLMQPVLICSYDTFSGMYWLPKWNNPCSFYGSGLVFSILTRPRFDPP